MAVFEVVMKLDNSIAVVDGPESNEEGHLLKLKGAVSMEDMKAFIQNMPKAELHLHIEGAIEPEMLLRLAKRNNVRLPFANEGEVWAAQDYGEPALQGFLAHYETCLQVLQREQDFFDVTYALVKKCHEENILHVEIMFDTQAHLARGVCFTELIEGVNSGRKEASAAFGVSTNLIMNFQREYSEASAMEILDLAAPYKAGIAGVGLDYHEAGDFPLKFAKVFKRARAEGYLLTAHCDCGYPDAVRVIHQCIDILELDRIDHGINVLDDNDLLAQVVKRKIPLTMCPTWRPSDPRPRRVDEIKKMLAAGVKVTVNSDDPAQFSSRYLTNTLTEVAKAGSYSMGEVAQLMRNAFEAAWISEEKKHRFIDALESYVLQQAS